jgi:hypothetical protein
LRRTTLTSVDASRFMVAGRARPWWMAETAANRTAPNSNNGSRPQHTSTRRNGNKGRNAPGGPVQQGPVRRRRAGLGRLPGLTGESAPSGPSRPGG